MQVSHAMASLLAERGQCFASVKTLAAKAGVSPSAVKKARPALDRLRLWRSKGTTGKTAVYLPLFNPPQPLAVVAETTRGVHERIPYTTSVCVSLMCERR